MDMRQGTFAVKLCELETEYSRLQSRIQVCQSKDAAGLRRERKRLREEYRKQDLLLTRRMRGCRVEAAAELAGAQREYLARAQRLCRGQLERELRGSNPTNTQDRAEASTLFAEYAIDFATQAMRCALSAAIQALELQKRAETRAGGRGRPGGKSAAPARPRPESRAD